MFDSPSPSLRWMLEYDFWVNEQLLKALRSHSNPWSARELFLPILNGYRLWLGRVVEGHATDPMPHHDATLSRTALDLAHLRHQWGLVLESYDLHEPIEYCTSSDTCLTSSLPEIITQLLVESAYYRGQIDLLLGAEVVLPSLTDFLQESRRKELVHGRRHQ